MMKIIIIISILFFRCSLLSFGQDPRMTLDDLFGGKFKLDRYTTSLIQHFDSMNTKDMDYDRSFDKDSIKLIHFIKRGYLSPLETVRNLMNQMNSYMDQNNLFLDLKSDTVFVLYRSTSPIHIGQIHMKTKKFHITIYNRDSINYGTTFDTNHSYCRDDKILNILYTWNIDLMIKETMNYIPPITLFSPIYELYRIIIEDQKVTKRELIIIPRSI